MKMLLPFLIILFFYSCSKEGENSAEESFELVFKGETLIYTKDSRYLVEAETAKGFYSVEFFESTNCNSDYSVGEYSKEELQNGQVSLPLSVDEEVYLYYKAYHMDSIVLADCQMLTHIYQDSTPPSVVGIDSSVLATTYNTNKSSVHFSIESSQDSDAYTMNIYSDNLKSTLLKSYSVSQWLLGYGQVLLSENATNTIYIEAEDRAGNVSSLVGPITYIHDNTPPNAPSLDNTLTDLDGSYTSDTSITILGTSDSDVESIEIYSQVYYSGANLLTTLTKSEFETGLSYTLNTDQNNEFYFYALDSFGNRSNYVKLSLYHVTSPVINISLELISSETPEAVINESATFLYTIHNTSTETTSGAYAPISSITLSSLDNGSIDLTSCASLAADSSCEFSLTDSSSVEQTKSYNLDLNVDGQIISYNFDIDFISPSAEILETQIDSSSVQTSVGQDPSKRYIVYDNAYIDLSDDTLVAGTSAEIAVMANASAYRDSLYVSKSGNSISLFDKDLSVYNSQVFFDFTSIENIKIIYLDESTYLSVSEGALNVLYEIDSVLSLTKVWENSNSGVPFVYNSKIRSMVLQETYNITDSLSDTFSDTLLSQNVYYNNNSYLVTKDSQNGLYNYSSESFLFNADSIFNEYLNDFAVYIYEESSSYYLTVLTDSTQETIPLVSASPIINQMGENILVVNSGTTDYAFLADEEIASLSFSNASSEDSFFIDTKGYQYYFQQTQGMTIIDTEDDSQTSDTNVTSFDHYAYNSNTLVFSSSNTVYILNYNGYKTHETISDLSGTIEVYNYEENFYISYLDSSSDLHIKKLAIPN